jgi:hypothetical protein
MSFEDDIEALINMGWIQENSNPKNKEKALKSYELALKKLSVC